MKQTGTIAASGAGASLIAPLLERLGQRVRTGTLVVRTPDDRAYEFRGADAATPRVEWHLHSWKTLLAVVSRGALGLGESYLAGYWSTPDLPAFMQFAADNERSLGGSASGISALRTGDRILHWLRRNSPRRARRNIASHYDLGNDFYRQWLDPSMTYSAALYAGEDLSLEQAQENKYARLARLAGVSRGSNVLEIGCGWGGFMVYAAGELGASVTGVSISAAQCEYAAARLKNAALETHTQVSLTDYRELDGRYDHIVSIEMFEAVGEAYWDTYAARLKQLLAPGGRAALQLITIEQARFEKYRREPDFIQRYVFPGGMLPSYAALESCLARQGLAITDRLDFGLDYARTLAAWRSRFDAAWDVIRRDGFDERFRRLWHFYLAYCEAGFRASAIDVVQVRIEHAD